jgi:hypothetical protein
MTSHEMESERTANADNQSANGEPGARWTGRRRNRCTPDLDRVLGEMAARPHLGGEGGPGRNGGTGPRGAGHRRRETPVPTSGEEVDEKAHHYDRIIGSCVETVTGHGHLFCSPALYTPCSLTRNLRVV